MTFELVIRGGTIGETTIPIERSKYTIGRSSGCNISIDDSSLNRQHAVLLKNGERLTIKDLKSSYGTFVNGNRIITETRLYDGDKLEFGSVKAMIQAVTDPTDVPIESPSESSVEVSDKPVESVSQNHPFDLSALFESQSVIISTDYTDFGYFSD